MLMTPFKKLEPQLFRFWNALSAPQKRALIQQLESIDQKNLKIQQNLLKTPLPLSAASFHPFENYTLSGSSETISHGQQLIRNNKVGCLVLAGGQGTRLKHEGPKGTYPISILKNKSLFQLCAEKVRAASTWAGVPLQLAIMTSPDNDSATQEFFLSHRFFGLDPTQVSFFVQGTLPLLDPTGKPFLKNPWEIAMGSDGNGNSLINFAGHGLLQKWTDLNMTAMTIIPIDNPLADPFDAELIGIHDQKQDEITLKCTEKTDPEEKVGALVEQEGQCRIIEYSEMPEEEKRAYRLNGKLKHCCANLGLFCLSLSFIARGIREGFSLPLHKARKAAHYVDDEGISHLSHHPIAWKFETFIFDWLLHAKKVSALISPREECFAPLKNASGADSPETVRKALQSRDQIILQSLTGLPPPPFPFELNAEFYYPTTSLKEKWRGKAATPSDFPTSV